MSEAEVAITRLCDLVEQVLASNQDMSRRLRALDDAPAIPTSAASLTSNDDTNYTPSMPGMLPVESEPVGVQANTYEFAFEEDLQASRVYRKPLCSGSRESLVTSAARTTASSILSALSLTDVSNISILAVPISAYEISNSSRYDFGEFFPSKISQKQLQAPHEQRLGKPSKADFQSNKWDGIASAVRLQRKDNPNQWGPSLEPGFPILGVPAEERNKYECVPLFTMETAPGEVAYSYGYVPVFVVRSAIYLVEKGMGNNPSTFYICL